MTTIRIHSPAKLNLFLHITGKRDDGYHDLQSIFQLIDASDEMIFSKNDSDDIRLHIISDKKITDSIDDNLIYKSAQLLKKTALQQTDKQHKYGCDITLHKQLPMGGGIGSGSSNAGMTLLVLNRLWGIDFGENQLASLGKQLGADVPIFIRSYFDDVYINQPNQSHHTTLQQKPSAKSKMAWVEGVGDLIDMLSMQEAEKILPENSTFCILKPAVHVSTASLFAHPELVRNTAKLCKTQTIADIANLKGADLKDAHLTDVKKPELINNFESIVCSLYPPVNEALTYLLDYCQKNPANPIITPRLTGTGACVFAVFDTALQAKHCLENAPCAGFLAKPCGKLNMEYG